MKETEQKNFSLKQFINIYFLITLFLCLMFVLPGARFSLCLLIVLAATALPNIANKITQFMLVMHFIIVCLLCTWSYLDINGLPAAGYFKFSHTFGIDRVTGNELEGIVFGRTGVFFPCIAIFIYCFRKFNVTNKGKKLFYHIALSFIQFLAMLPLIS